MKRTAYLATAIFLISIVAVPSASAGGATWVLNGMHSPFAAIAPGQTIRATASLWMPIVRESGRNGQFYGGPQHAPFYGWIFHRPDPSAAYAPPLPDDAIQVGEVVFHETDEPKMMRLSLTFEMPDVPPGEYGLVTCNEDCERQIGDLWMTRFTVAEDVAQAVLTRRVNRLDYKLTDARMRLKDKTDDLQRLRSRSASEIAALEEELEELRARPLATREPSRVPVGTWPFVAASIFVALAAIALFGTRGRTTFLEH